MAVPPIIYLTGVLSNMGITDSYHFYFFVEQGPLNAYV